MYFREYVVLGVRCHKEESTVVFYYILYVKLAFGNKSFDSTSSYTCVKNLIDPI